MAKAEQALEQLTKWSDRSEVDFYYYVKEFFHQTLGYPVDNIVLTETGAGGGIPDISLCAKDARPQQHVFWVVGEIKPKPGLFRDKAVRRERWNAQLSRYITSDTIYSLLMDPTTLVVLKPNGEEVLSVRLDKISASELLSHSAAASISFLTFENSVSEVSLTAFESGDSPSRFIDVTTDEGRDEFYRTLHVSSDELVDYSLARIRTLNEDYELYKSELVKLDSKAPLDDGPYKAALKDLQKQHRQSITFSEKYLEEFRGQIGKALPRGAAEERDYLLNVYATEGSSLLLARILFVRFSEDHGLTTRKISNGGVKRYREFYENVKDDYRHLLVTAFKDLEQKYARLFEPSIFDWAHEGNGELSSLLLRIFHRLNAFDFEKITGDLLGNLYERFLPIEKRKKLGEYYTPLPIAEYVLERIGFFDHPGPLMDPACGSGTFLIAAAEGLVRRMVKRGVKPTVAVKEALALVNGVDINVFASFIAQLQLIWHVFPYLARDSSESISLPELQVFGGLSSLVWFQHTLSDSLLREYADRSQEIRDGNYRYIVGNPPYIRNERLKDRGPWRDYFEDVDHRNSDIAFFFVQRAIVGGRKHNRKGPDTTKDPWLESGGRLCFVLPHGICDSDAARPLREVILGRKVIEITDLEDVAHAIFPSPLASSRATTAPILLFVEQASPDPSSELSIVQVPKEALGPTSLDRTRLVTSSVGQSEILESRLNPDNQILTKLRSDDLPYLKKIRNHPSVLEFAGHSTPTYGIKVGRAGELSSEPGSSLKPLRKGANISAYRLDPHVSSWVDLKKVESQSIWRDCDALEAPAYALSGITLAPQCAKIDPRSTCLNDSSRLFVPNEEGLAFPWDVLFNSSPVRFTYDLTLRAGLVGVGTPIGEGRTASWCCIYPRSISLLPVPEDLVRSPSELSGRAKSLRETAEVIGSRWESVIEACRSEATHAAALHDVDFSNWGPPKLRNPTYNLVRHGGKSTLEVASGHQKSLCYLEGPYAALNIIRYAIETRLATPESVQQFKLPADVDRASHLIDEARDPESAPIKKFRRVQAECDEIIAEAFGLSVNGYRYISGRLAEPPLDVLQPRWPWTAVEIRDIQEYDSDRFA